MKGIISLIIFFNYFSIVKAQFILRSGIIKVETTLSATEIKEYGTGNIIGSDSNNLYILTAAHVVFPLNEDGEIIDETPVLKVIYESMQGNSINYISFPAEVIAKDIVKDILIAKIPIHGLSDYLGTPLQFGFFGFIKGMDTLCNCTSLYNSNMSITGFSGAAVQETETLSGQLYTRTLADDNKYFVLKNIPLEVGFSGSLVQWFDGQVLGMLLSKMGGDKAIVIRMEIINQFLKANNIPDNMLKSHSLIGQWQVDSIILPPNSVVHSLKRNKKMIFKSNSMVEGLGNGTFCFIQDGIQLFTQDTLEYVQSTGGFISLFLLSFDSGIFKLDDPSDHRMWNFSGPNFTRRRLTNNWYTIYLTKIE